MAKGGLINLWLFETRVMVLAALITMSLLLLLLLLLLMLLLLTSMESIVHLFVVLGALPLALSVLSSWNVCTGVWVCR